MARLRRTQRLADDFFLMVHDDLSGRPRLSDRILGLGLAAALLGELIFLDDIDIDIEDEDEFVTAIAAAPPPDPLLAEVFGELQDEPRLSVRDWLDYLGRHAPDRVARRLEAQGLIYLKAPRVKLPGRAGRWTPTDLTTAGWPAIDVKLKIHNGRADAHNLMLFGLTHATGLNHPSLYEIQRQLQDPAVLETTLQPLVVFNSPLLDLLAHTEAAVGSAVASQRIS